MTRVYPLILRKVVLLSAVLFFVLSSGIGYAQCVGNGQSPQTWTTASNGVAEVNACIAAAASGDTILVQPAGTVSWGSAASIPSNKCLTIDGQNNVTITSGAGFAINVGTACSTRITGFTFTANGGLCDYDPDTAGGAPICVWGPVNGYPYRIDHNTWTSAATGIWISGHGAMNGPGLIDHNFFASAGSNNELIHQMGTDDMGGPGTYPVADWNSDLYPGNTFDPRNSFSPLMVFIEDNVFCPGPGTITGASEPHTCPSSSNSYYSAVQNFAGARSAIRHNEFHCGFIDAHGTAGYTGTRWLEIYNNDYWPDGNNCYTYADIRAGSGVMFNNVVKNSNSAGSPDIRLREDDTSGPWSLAYQVGSGINGYTDGHASCGTLNQAPFYLWNNTIASGGNITINTSISNYVQLNRDVLVSTNQPSTMTWDEKAADTCSTNYTYTPYTYPHPLQTGDPSVAPPTNLNASVQ